jgi:SAM-dependent methyltransferase
MLSCTAVKLAELLQRVAPWRQAPVEKWRSGLDAEAQFWRSFLAQVFLAQPRTFPSEWFQEFEARLEPQAPLQPWITALLAEHRARQVKILDVGSGPFTVVGKKWRGHVVTITAVDPLAATYQAILAELHVEPPVLVGYACAETLHAVVPESSFDLVVAHNSLDHCYSPVEALRSALRVVKPACWVGLWHVENEGQREGYADLHQWNFTSELGRFVIWNRKERCADVLGALPQARQIVVEHQRHHETEWLHVRIQRSG